MSGYPCVLVGLPRYYRYMKQSDSSEYRGTLGRLETNICGNCDIPIPTFPDRVLQDLAHAGHIATTFKILNFCGSSLTSSDNQKLHISVNIRTATGVCYLQCKRPHIQWKNLTFKYFLLYVFNSQVTSTLIYSCTSLW